MRSRGLLGGTAAPLPSTARPARGAQPCSSARGKQTDDAMLFALLHKNCSQLRPVPQLCRRIAFSASKGKFLPLCAALLQLAPVCPCRSDGSLLRQRSSAARAGPRAADPARREGQLSFPLSFSLSCGPTGLRAAVSRCSSRAGSSNASSGSAPALLHPERAGIGAGIGAGIAAGIGAARLPGAPRARRAAADGRAVPIRSAPPRPRPIPAMAAAFRALRVLLGLFFLLAGAVKLSERLSADAHRQMVRGSRGAPRRTRLRVGGAAGAVPCAVLSSRSSSCASRRCFP